MNLAPNLFQVLAHSGLHRDADPMGHNDRTLFVVPGSATTASTTSSYSQVFARAASFVTVLAEHGVEPGDRVIAQVTKSVDAAALYLACLQLGAIEVPLNTAYTHAELAYFVSDAAPTLVVTDEPTTIDGAASVTLSALAAAADGADPATGITQRRGSDVAMMLYTSGTTGRSKGAMLSHDALIANARGLAGLWEFDRDDVLLHVLPIFHVHGLFVALHCALLSGCSVYFPDRFDADQVVDLLPGCTTMMGVPTHYTRLLDHPRFDRNTCRSMRLFTSGSAPMTASVHSEFEQRTGHRIVERYGMTECGIITSNPYRGDRVAGTVGMTLPATEVRVRIDDQRDGAPNETGMVEMRGPGLMVGYWNRPDATASEMRDGGWFVTGDVGSLDDEGRLTLEGRSGDMIISGGYNVYPKEIELVLDAVAGVVESAVVGVPHPDFGEGIVAVVVGDVEHAALQGALDEHLARFKHPRRIEFVDALPRNTMGKVQKQTLRAELADSFAQP
jgi:malonyl-CoA/methylmalonyl-CoA synthetase